MAQCPKCGKKLKLYHWRPECPFCGVNMIYYNSNDRILEETERAEAAHALTQPRIDRAKASTIGSPLAVIRLILSAMPIGALFLPLGKLPGAEKALNAVTIYKHINSVCLQSVIGAVADKSLTYISLLLLLLSAVMILVCLICLIMSLGKHGVIRNFILNMIWLAFAVGAAVCFTAGEGHLLFGAFIYILLITAVLVFNLFPARKWLKAEYTTCYVGGLPSDEYFALRENGASELEIRRKMVDALTVMQKEAREKAAREEADALRKRAERR